MMSNSKNAIDVGWFNRTKVRIFFHIWMAFSKIIIKWQKKIAIPIKRHIILIKTYTTRGKFKFSESTVGKTQIFFFANVYCPCPRQ